LQNIPRGATLSQMKLEEIQAPVIAQLNETSALMQETLHSDVELINRIRDIVPLSKGKKVRSTLLFLLSGASENNSGHLPAIASSIELIHLASLIHDDILDNAVLRRGVNTLNHELGNLISVLGGDFLFLHSLNLMNRLDNPALMRILLESTQIMVEGQLQEIANNFNYGVSLETYLEIIRKKTSVRFGAISGMAAAVIGKDSRTETEYYEFGIHLGNMFQIVDDLIDIFSTNSGKDRFRDLQEGKITLPFILLQKAVGGEDITGLFTVQYSEKLIELFETHRIRDRCHEKLDEYYNQCNGFLSRFPPSGYRDSLKGLLDFIRFREY